MMAGSVVQTHIICSNMKRKYLKLLYGMHTSPRPDVLTQISAAAQRLMGMMCELNHHRSQQ